MSKAPDSEYVRITLDVPEDTLKLLDQMKDFAGYASRGRTIQALVDAVVEMGVDTQGMNKLIEAFQKQAQSLQTANQQVQVGAILIFLTQFGTAVGSIQRRLSRFVKTA